MRSELEDYLGSVNEVKQGLRKSLLPKPEALHLFELCKSTGLPLVAGGLLDQPHIWVMQWEICESVVEMYEALNRHNEQMDQGKNLMSPMRIGRNGAT